MGSAVASCDRDQCGLLSKNDHVQEKGDHDARMAEPVARTMVLQISSGVRAEIPEASDVWPATERHRQDPSRAV